MKRWAICGLVVLGLVGTFTLAQESKGISWKHGLSFQVRKAGETTFTKDTKAYGAEVFLDKDINQLVYINEKASLGLGTAGKLQEGDVKAPLLYHAIEVRVRPAGENGFGNAKKFSSEVFRDPNTDNLVYISETGSMAVAPAAGVSAPEKTVKDPEWYHGLEVKVRKADEKEFGKDTKKVSLEVYKDPNTNQLVYVTDAGAIAIVPSAGVGKPDKVEGPTWYHAFVVKVRKADEKQFSKDTRAYGVEVYLDPNAKTLLYVSETGSIAVVPAGGLGKPSSSKEPKWLYGRAFRVRRADEKDFNDKTQSWGAEVYRDETSGNLVYMTEEGNLVVSGGK
jgi:hypothetical protein